MVQIATSLNQYWLRVAQSQDTEDKLFLNSIARVYKANLVDLMECYALLNSRKEITTMKNPDLYISPYGAKKKKGKLIYFLLSIVFGGYALALLWCFIKL